MLRSKYKKRRFLKGDESLAESDDSSGPSELLSQYFGINFCYSRVHSCTAESFVLASRHSIQIPMDLIIPVLEEITEQQDMFIELEGKLRKKLLILAN